MHCLRWIPAIVVAVGFVPEARPDPRTNRKPVTRAEIDRLEQKVADQQRLLDNLVQLQAQYVQQLLALLPDSPGSSRASGGEPKSAENRVIAKADGKAENKIDGKPENKSDGKAEAKIDGKANPSPGEPRPTPAKTKLTPKAVGTIVGKVTGGGGDAYIYVEDIVATTAGTATMKQENKQFTPRILAVSRGTKVDFPNLDAVFHNVFSVTPDNSFDLGSYHQGSSKSVTLLRSGVVTVYCNMHPQMVGYILVVPSKLYVHAGQDGFYRLPNVPAGHHRVVAWAPNAKPMALEVDVGDADSATLEFELKQGHAGPHTNKDGMAYGSYKD